MFCFNLAQTPEDADRRVRGKESSQQITFQWQLDSLFPWFQILDRVKLDVPLVQGVKGQETEFAGAWAICLSNESSALVFVYTW